MTELYTNSCSLSYSLIFLGLSVVSDSILKGSREKSSCQIIIMGVLATMTRGCYYDNHKVRDIFFLKSTNHKNTTNHKHLQMLDVWLLSFFFFFTAARFMNILTLPLWFLKHLLWVIHPTKKLSHSFGANILPFGWLITACMRLSHNNHCQVTQTKGLPE